MLNRFIKIHGNIEFERYDSNNWEIMIRINRKDLVLVLMELYLLEYKHSQILTVKSYKSSLTLSICVFGDLEEIYVNSINNKYEIRLTQNGLQYIISFLLKYYRDSYAPVDHTHLSISNKSPLGRSGDLTIIAEDSAKPMSGEEAKRILEDM